MEVFICFTDSFALIRLRWPLFVFSLIIFCFVLWLDNGCFQSAQVQIPSHAGKWCTVLAGFLMFLFNSEENECTQPPGSKPQ